MLILQLLILIASFSVTVYAEDPWNFIVIADWHGAETFGQRVDNEADIAYTSYREVFRKIKNTYGGDLIMIPGDTQTGHWYKPGYRKHLKDMLGFPDVPKVAPSIRISGQNCFRAIKKIFEESGYDTVLATVGDHEIGGNPWSYKSSKMKAGLDHYRDTFVQSLNKNSDNSFIGNGFGNEQVGDLSRPIGTPFENTSFAYVHKNSLYVTVDVYDQISAKKKYFNRKKSFGGEGIVTCTVRGNHLKWFENVLKLGRSDPSIDHIFVQAHVPILQPVRKNDCSGQFFDGAENSLFWKTMRKYKVDVYFAGEVHANTVTKDPQSNLLQVVSRGNRVNNFLSVHVTNSTFTIKAYNEIGEDWKFNGEYEEYGYLSVEKNGARRNITSSGVLEIVDPSSKPLIKLDFDQEDTYPLHTRQIIGMKHDQHEQMLIGTSITIRGQNSATGMENKGIFTRQYDAQVANLDFDNEDKINGNSSGVFTDKTRVAIYSVGPMGGGEIISLSIFFKTTQTQEQVLVFYGGVFGPSERKDIFLLSLKEGNPFLRFTTNLKQYVTSENDLNLNDGQWHHIAVSMPKKSCLYSEVIIYVDGVKIVRKTLTRRNLNVFFVTSGKLSLGGFGYSNNKYDAILKDIHNFNGKMDKFMLWGGKSFPKSFVSHDGFKCKNTETRSLQNYDTWEKCFDTCFTTPNCWGYEWRLSESNMCYHFYDERPEVGDALEGSYCFPVAA